MHPNAEIGYFTEMTSNLFNTILEIQGGSGGGGGGKKDDGVTSILMDYKTRTPPMFNMLTINEKVKEKTPFVVVCLQECERMNELL